jgi:hypothetical protein
MGQEISIMNMLSDKTKEDIKLFVINSFLSTDEEKRKEFERLIHKVIIDCTLNQKINKN